MNSTEELNPTAEPETNTREKIVEAYRKHILEHGMEPASIYAFSKKLGIEESEFYDYFNDFSQVADAFWTKLFRDTRETLETGEEYRDFSAREKLLSFYFDFFARLKQHRSYFLLSFDDGFFSLSPQNRHLSEMSREFKDWASALVMEGIGRNEISARSRLTETYHSLFWYQFLFLMNFWKKDRSRGFEKTDAAIEKAVNLSFDLIEKNALDSAFDFGKFMFQNR